MSNEFTVEQLQELIKCAAENKIGEFLYEDEGVKLRIRGPRAAHPVLPVQAEGIALTAPAAVQPQEAAPAQEDKPASENNIVSPIVGKRHGCGNFGGERRRRRIWPAYPPAGIKGGDLDWL